jgi:threonine dehydrogenase-like Zn-dependent dehydrogenase
MEVNELWHISDTDSVIRKTQVDDDSADVIVKSFYSLISAGTERIISKGQVPTEIEQQMNVPFMNGNFPFPVSYGYSLVGKVVKGPEYLANRFVHLLHPHHDFALVNEKDIFLIPDAVPDKRAVYASNMETVVNAIWDSKFQLGDKLLIVGFGTIGALLALTLSEFTGVEVMLSDNNSERKKIAKDCGLQICEEGINPEYFDICFHCSGSENGLQFCIDHAKTEGKIIELSWYGNKSVNIHIGGSFHTGRKSIISSQVSNIPKNKAFSWDFRKRKELVFKLLENEIYDRLPCIEIPFLDTPNFFNRLRNEHINEPGIIIRY